jgi:hypothetical protein
MTDRITISKLQIGGKERPTERAELLLHDVGLSWGMEIDSNDPELAGYLSGDVIQVEMETAEGAITGEAKVLRCLGGDPVTIELFGFSDLLKGEEVWRPMYNA